MLFIKYNLPPLVALLIAILATGYTIFDRSTVKELFILYGAEVSGLYGLSQQDRIKLPLPKGDKKND